MKKSIKLWHLFVYIIVLILVLLTGWIEYRSRYHAVLDMLRNQAEATAAAIALGGSRQAALSTDLQQAYIQRALDLIHTVDQLEREGLLTPERLEELISGSNFFHLNIFTADGELTFGSGSFTGYGRGQMGGGRGMIRLLAPLFSGQQDTLVVTAGGGLMRGQPGWLRENPPGPGRGRSGVIIGIRQPGGGVIAGNLTVEAERNFQSVSSLQNLLNDMLDIAGVAYLTLAVPGQEPYTVARAGLDPAESTNWTRDPLDPQTALITAAGHDYIELHQSLTEFGPEAELLVGFTTEPLTQAKREAAWHILFRSGLFTALMLLIIAIAFSRQNTALLAAEKDRIEGEVIRLQKLSHLQDKQVAIGQLAAGLAHEIRNPLNAIGIIGQRIRREVNPAQNNEEFRQMTDTMTTEIKRVNVLLEEFLSFTRPTPLTIETVDVQTLVEDAANLFSAPAEEQGLSLKVTTEAPGKIEGDPHYLQQALSNLIRNALDATQAGDEINLVALRQKGEVVIQVRDTGQGIPPEKINRIFDLFYTTRDQGTGIGLAVTHKIVADHGGTIEVDSQAGEGATFTVILPATRS